MTWINVVGTVARLAGDDLAYAVTRESAPRSVSFGADTAADFSGETLSELGFAEGAVVSLGLDPSSGIVQRAVRMKDDDRRDRSSIDRDKSDSLPRSKPIADGLGQNVLLPEDEPAEKIKVPRAMPVATRRFGKILDTRLLKPGDLLLSRDLNPDWTGRAIVSVQEKGGYDPVDARWTHAAMYLGDGAHVVEATFESPMTGGSVRLTNLDEYCKGEAALRFRRPRHIETDEERWKLCVRALKRLHKPYSFSTAVQMWLRVAVGGGGFFDDDLRFGASDAVICSTLYADAYNETTRRTLGETCGACVPAWLSVTDDFNDLGVGWLAF